MKTSIFFLSILLSVSLASAQSDSSKFGKFYNKLDKLPDMFIPSYNTPTDSALSILKNDNLVLIIHPQWSEKGTQMNNDIKIPKINEDPLLETFPLPERNTGNTLTITMATYKKSADEKKNGVLNLAKTHLAAYYKEAGKAISADELTANAKYFTSGPVAFTTAEGKTGEVYTVNDIAPQQTSFIVFLIIPGTKPGTTVFVQFAYTRYTYESVVPDDYTELRYFVYPDDQKIYTDFTKTFFKTLQIH